MGWSLQGHWKVKVLYGENIRPFTKSRLVFHFKIKTEFQWVICIFLTRIIILETKFSRRKIYDFYIHEHKSYYITCMFHPLFRTNARSSILSLWAASLKLECYKLFDIALGTFALPSWLLYSVKFIIFILCCIPSSVLFLLTSPVLLFLKLWHQNSTSCMKLIPTELSPAILSLLKTNIEMRQLCCG